MASPSPAVTQGQGSAGVIVKFPDGFQANIATIGGVQAGPANVINVVQNPTAAAFAAPVFVYTCFSLQEQVVFLAQIDSAIAAGTPNLQLISYSPLPSPGDASANNSIFVNGLNIAGAPTVSTAGKSQIILTVGDIAGGFWPAPIPPAGIDVNASFRPDGQVLMNGRACYNYQYINALTIQMRCPPNLAGTYDIIYSDSRGTVTKTGGITYA